MYTGLIFYVVMWRTPVLLASGQLLHSENKSMDVVTEDSFNQDVMPKEEQKSYMDKGITHSTV